jgi:adenylate cyclase
MPSEIEEMQKIETTSQEDMPAEVKAEVSKLDLSQSFSQKREKKLFSTGKQGTLYILFLIILGIIFQILYLYQHKLPAELLFNSSILFILFLTIILSFRAIKERRYSIRLASLLNTNISFNPDLDYNGILKTVMELGESFIRGYSITIFLIDEKRGIFSARVTLNDGIVRIGNLSVIETALLGDINKGVIDAVLFKGKDLKKIAAIFGGRKARSAYFLPLENQNRRLGLMVFFSSSRTKPLTEDMGLLAYIPRISTIFMINNEIYRENKEIEAKEMRKDSEWRRKRLEIEEELKKLNNELLLTNKKLAGSISEKEKFEGELSATKKELESQIKKATDELAKAYLELDNKEKEFGKKVLEQLAVKELNQAIEFLFDEGLILDLVLNIAVSELKASAGAVMLQNPETNRLEMRFQRGFAEDEKDKKRLLCETIAGYVNQKKEPLLVINLEKEPKFIPITPASPSSPSSTSMLAVPIKSQNNIIGVISLYNKVSGEVFNSEDLNILSTLSRQASNAVENARLYEGIAQGKRLRSVYGKYLSESLINKLKVSSKELDLVGTRQRAVVLSLQISGLGQSLGIIPTNQAITILNKYFSFLTDILYKYDASIDRLTGNGFIAVFGIPFTKADDAKRAVTAGVDMVIRFLKKIKAEGDDKLNIGISVGISSGEVMIGEIGTGEHRRTTIIGDVVDLSGRLQWMALSGQVLVDEPTFRAVSDIFLAQKTGSVPIPGGKTMEIYGIVKLKR